MDLDRNIFENADTLAATGANATTIQTWANRGIVALSETQRNPGLGQKRLYSGLDVARIAAMQGLIDRGLFTNAAGQIAFRLEKSPQTANNWRKALEQTAPHIYVLVDGTDVACIYVGNDATELARFLTAMNEPLEGGAVGEGAQIQTKTALFDLGPEVCSAIQKLQVRKNARAGRRYTLMFRPAEVRGQISVSVEATPTFEGGKSWRKVFPTVDNFASALAIVDLSARELRGIRESVASGNTHQWGVAIPEESLVQLGMIEDSGN